MPSFRIVTSFYLQKNSRRNIVTLSNRILNKDLINFKTFDKYSKINIVGLFARHYLSQFNRKNSPDDTKNFFIKLNLLK